MTNLPAHSSRGSWVVLVLVAALASSAPSGLASEEPAAADILLRNGRVYTLSWGEPTLEGAAAADAPHDERGWHPDAQALAIRDGRLVFVGSDAEAERHRGSGTRVIDLAGATVLPGLAESHGHPSSWGRALARVDLVGVETEEEAIARLEARARETKAGEWVVGWGFDEGAWANRYPSMTRVSQRIPEHPVYASGLHGFAAWGNRLAFERAGIGAGTRAPVGGEIRLDPEGEPTGILLNNATDLLREAVPAPSDADRDRATERALTLLAQGGYVVVHAAGVGREDLASYRRLAAAARLPVRLYAMLDGGDAGLISEWSQRGPDRQRDGMLTVRCVKAFYDASLGARGARLLEDYADKPGHRGVSGGDYGFDEELIAEAMRAGFQVGIHAIGDAGNRASLDFFEKVFRDAPGVRADRHRIEHAQVVHPTDQARFALLDIIASMEPPHCVEDMVWAENRLGPERVRHAYAWRSLRRKGVRLTFNSDFGGSDHDIFYGLHAAITRRNKQKLPPSGWHPGEAMAPEEALRGYTSWSAYAAFVEDLTGTLEVGKWADITVMDLDPLVVGSSDPGRLLEGRVLLTIVAGKIVHDAS